MFTLPPKFKFDSSTNNVRKDKLSLSNQFVQSEI